MCADRLPVSLSHPDVDHKGCGISGLWASGMGSLFPSATVVGIDLVPVQIERAPQNVSFEIFDVVQGLPL